jgi:hypothetical protein
MEAVRCKQCGETRWSCELCGGETVVERRRPGAGPDVLGVERRRAAMAGRIAGGDAARPSGLATR